MESIIKVACIKHIYPDKTEVRVCGLEFVVKKSERVVVLGPNGAGKTTLLSHILGLLSPVDGTVEVLGKDPSKYFKEIRKKIGVVFQNVDEQIIGPRVFDDIAFTPRNDGWTEEEVIVRVEAVAKKLKIEGLMEKIPHYLSGGQRKKVALAGALVMNPEILVLDEPFNGLDPESKKEMIAIFNHLQKESGTTIIMTTHDINLVPAVADTVYILNQGQIIGAGRPEEIFCRTDLLKEASLEPPILHDLFYRFRQKGYDTGHPMTVTEAETEIMRMFEQQRKER